MTAGYLGGYLGYAASGGGGGDLDPPVDEVMSPAPDTPPGDPGGFVADWAVARMTPIVVRITDAAPGNVYQCVVARYPGAAEEIVVYRRGEFRGVFHALSTATEIPDGIELSILPLGGWVSSDVLEDLQLEVDAVDAAGNLNA